MQALKKGVAKSGIPTQNGRVKKPVFSLISLLVKIFFYGQHQVF